MSNVIEFPSRDCIVIIEGTDVEIGRPLFLLEYICGGSRTVVGEYGTPLEVAQAAIEWAQDGVEVRA